MTGTLFESRELKQFLIDVPLPLKKQVPSPTKKKKVIVISGPTGAGKTELSLIIAQAVGGEVISADSIQVYRGMDIGTAKVSKSVREEIPHHLIDIKDLSESFNVVDFYQEAYQAIDEITAREHVPIVVGGTGFYIHALLFGPPTGPSSVPEVRNQIEEQIKREGVSSLYKQLQTLDPDYALTISHHDRHKIIRALEIITLTHQKVSYFKPLSTSEALYDFRCWFIHLPKEILYSRIDQRCEFMLQQGFLEEVELLEKRGLRSNLSAAQAIGYRQALDFLQTERGEGEREKFLFLFKQASRRYAKRQFTWFRKEPLFRWIDLSTLSLETAAEMILQDYEFTL
jgi:tRNA dimethylallyltransferase